MSTWLLILIVSAQSAGTIMVGGIDTDVTLHDFPSRDLCESAAKFVVKEVEQTYKTGVEYRCLEREAGKWK